MKDRIGFYCVTIPLPCCKGMQLVSETGSKEWRCMGCNALAPSHLADEADAAHWQNEAANVKD